MYPLLAVEAGVENFLLLAGTLMVTALFCDAGFQVRDMFAVVSNNRNSGFHVRALRSGDFVLAVGQNVNGYGVPCGCLVVWRLHSSHHARLMLQAQSFRCASPP